MSRTRCDRSGWSRDSSHTHPLRGSEPRQNENIRRDVNRLEAMDSISAEQRSLLMGRIRSKDTQPERVVRSIIHRMGYRFRLHQKDLPGKPDVVLSRHRKIVLIQGCFWHGHTCRLASKPKSNTSYWQTKIATNRARDLRNTATLAEQGWKVLELWECEIRAGLFLQKLRRFMGAPVTPKPNAGKRQGRSEQSRVSPRSHQRGRL